MALQSRSKTHQAYAQIRRHPVSTSKEGHSVLSNIHSNYKNNMHEKKERPKNFLRNEVFQRFGSCVSDHTVQKLKMFLNTLFNANLTKVVCLALDLGVTRADQKTGGALSKFSGRTGMHEKSRVSSAIKYDCFKLNDSGNCIARKT